MGTYRPNLLSGIESSDPLLANPEYALTRSEGLGGLTGFSPSIQSPSLQDISFVQRIESPSVVEPFTRHPKQLAPPARSLSPSLGNILLASLGGGGPVRTLLERTRREALAPVIEDFQTGLNEAIKTGDLDTAKSYLQQFSKYAHQTEQAKTFYEQGIKDFVLLNNDIARKDKKIDTYLQTVSPSSDTYKILMAARGANHLKADDIDKFVEQSKTKIDVREGSYAKTRPLTEQVELGQLPSTLTVDKLPEPLRKAINAYNTSSSVQRGQLPSLTEQQYVDRINKIQLGKADAFDIAGFEAVNRGLSQVAQNINIGTALPAGTRLERGNITLGQAGDITGLEYPSGQVSQGVGPQLPGATQVPSQGQVPSRPSSRLSQPNYTVNPQLDEAGKQVIMKERERLAASNDPQKDAKLAQIDAVLASPAGSVSTPISTTPIEVRPSQVSGTLTGTPEERALQESTDKRLTIEAERVKRDELARREALREREVIPGNPTFYRLDERGNLIRKSNLSPNEAERHYQTTNAEDIRELNAYAKLKSEGEALKDSLRKSPPEVTNGFLKALAYTYGTGISLPIRIPAIGVPVTVQVPGAGATTLTRDQVIMYQKLASFGQATERYMNPTGHPSRQVEMVKSALTSALTNKERALGVIESVLETGYYKTLGLLGTVEGAVEQRESEGARSRRESIQYRDNPPSRTPNTPPSPSSEAITPNLRDQFTTSTPAGTPLSRGISSLVEFLGISGAEPNTKTSNKPTIPEGPPPRFKNIDPNLIDQLQAQGIDIDAKLVDKSLKALDTFISRVQTNIKKAQEEAAKSKFETNEIFLGENLIRGALEAATLPNARMALEKLNAAINKLTGVKGPINRATTKKLSGMNDEPNTEQ